jgi:predicted nucleotidyltransferase
MSEKFGLNQKTFDLIIATLKSYPEIKQATIFGSRAMGNYKPGSDIDIALYGNIDQEQLARIRGILEDEISTPYLYDVVVYNQIDNDNLIKHIDKYGVKLF